MAGLARSKANRQGKIGKGRIRLILTGRRLGKTATARL
jgi:hypothetical protein